MRIIGLLKYRSNYCVSFRGQKNLWRPMQLNRLCLPPLVSHQLYTYKVSQTEYEYEIDLYSGTVLDYDAEYHSSEYSEDAVYIGESKALEAALEHAGVSAASLREKHVELDRDGSVMIYKVEFETINEEYEYKIDATTGAVLHAEKHSCTAKGRWDGKSKALTPCEITIHFEEGEGHNA